MKSESRSVVSDSLRPHGLYRPWNSLGQNTGVGSLSLLRGIFPTQGSNPGLLHCRWILYQLSHQDSPKSPEESFTEKKLLSTCSSAPIPILKYGFNFCPSQYLCKLSSQLRNPLETEAVCWSLVQDDQRNEWGWGDKGPSPPLEIHMAWDTSFQPCALWAWVPQPVKWEESIWHRELMWDQKSNRYEDPLSTAALRNSLYGVFFHRSSTKGRHWIFVIRSQTGGGGSVGGRRGCRAKTWVTSPSGGLKWKGYHFQMGGKATKTELTKS